MATGGDFELLYSTKVNQKIPIAVYQSTRTSLKVVVAEVDGPVVNGYFCLATEAHDDDGLPHTLEHLIFMGSERYPYKGMLDVLANRCLASGTNAWTDTDHTCYTMTTAGCNGFLTLLPIYIDHILNPLLTEESYLTEVHHINGDGEDGGVVYCEMQGCENTGESLVHRSMIQAIYPGHCGYKSETGGLMKNLRESTSIVKVRNYHRDYYQSQNLVLIITGKIAAADIFDALKPVEETIVASAKFNTPFQRPWQNPVPPLAISLELEVPYPCEDEEKGMVWLAWRGPSAVYQLYDISALMILMEYLTDTAASPLQKAFVEIAEAYASKVDYSFIENAESIVYLKFDNVPVGKLDEIRQRLFDFIGALGSDACPFDMERVQLVIQRRILEQLSHLENNPHDSIAYMVIADALYGRSHEDLRRRLNQIQDLEAIAKESPSFWSNIMRQYLLNRPCVTTKGRPSRAIMEAMATSEEQRLEEQHESLGQEGVESAARALLQALEQHNKMPPIDLISSVPIPDINSVTFHPIKRYCNRHGTSPDTFDLDAIGLRFQLDHVSTNFVYLFALMDTNVINEEERLYLPLLMHCLLESAVERDGVVIPYDEVVAQLASDTVKATTSLGLDYGADNYFFCGSQCQTAVLALQLQREKYESGIGWLRQVLRHTVFSADRVSVIATKMAGDVSRLKRKGDKMAMALLRDLVFDRRSNHRACSLIRQQFFLNRVVTELSDPTDAQRLVDRLTSLRDRLARPDALTLHMAADIDAFDGLLQPWTPWMSDGADQPSAMASAPTAPSAAAPPPAGAALSLGCVESSFLVQTVACISDDHHEDLAAVLVALQYFSQLEGPFWRQLRAQGLVYGYHLNLNVSEGLLYLSLYRASHPVAAYKQVRAILEAHASAEVWQESLLESARSSLVFELVEKEKAVGDVVKQSVSSYLKGVAIDYNKQLIQRVSRVTLSSVTRAFNDHVTALLDARLCQCAVVCHPSKVDEIVAGITAAGQPLQTFTSIEDSPLNQSL